jgi:predicted phage terminase large subunit-like protein
MSLTSPEQTKITVKHSKATIPQTKFWNSNARFRLFVGGIGSGKTRAGTIEAFRQPPNSVGMIVAPTYPMLRDATLRTFLELARAANILVNFKAGDMVAKLRGERTVLFRSGENPDRLRGPNLGWFMLDEAAMLSDEVWNIMIGRLREEPSRGWAVTTPRGKNWLYSRFTNGKDCEIIKSSSRDNPYLPEGFIESLESSYTAEWQAQEIDGDFLDPSGAMFRRQWFNIIEKPPHNLQWVRFWDLAASTRTNADFSASIEQAMDEEGNLYLRNGIHMKAEWPDVRKIIITNMLANPNTHYYIEKALHGIAAIQELNRIPELANIVLNGIDIERDKISRAMPWASRAESGKVFIVNGNWTNDFLDEVAMFPQGKHDDYVDSVSGGLSVVFGGGKLLLWD